MSDNSYNIEMDFPNLRNNNYIITSPKTEDYNCIAWAASDQDNWWWPDEDELYYWPDEAPRENTIEAFIGRVTKELIGVLLGCFVK